MSEQEQLEKLYSEVLRIRVVEDEIMKIYSQREMRTPTHFCTGQEAISVGVCSALRPSDQLFAFYRSHGWYLAKGGRLPRMIDEFFGKVSGCSHGVGGSMHLIDLEAGVQGTTAIVAGAIPHAVGAAFALRYNKTDNIAVTAFGDAATEEGVFTESIMFAVLRKLPVLFVCENNRLATNTTIEHRQPNVPIHERVRAMGIHAELLDGNDVLAVSKAAKAAVQRARSGEGPTFLECTTYRFLEHCGPLTDYHLGHRTEEEGEEWKAKDPVFRLEQKVSDDLRASLTQKYRQEVHAAFESARKAPFPTTLIPEGVQCL